MLARTLLIVGVVLSGGAVRADLITPDSISPMPTGWVTDQYKGLGLVFPTPSVSWSIGTYYGYGGWQFSFTDWNRGPDGAPIGPPIQDIQSGYQSASFVMPGTGAPATTDSIRVKVNSPADTVFTLTGYDLTGRSIASRDMLVDAYTDRWLTLRAAGMHSFEISSMWAPSVPGPWLNLPNFVMEAVEFQPVAAIPEPGSLTLFALGILVLAIRPWARSERRVVESG